MTRSRLLDELTSRIGYAETIELLRSWGGRRLSIPDKLTPDHPIALAIGLAPALQLAYFYGGTALDLPAERTALLEVRNACIMRDLNRDTVRAVAIRYGVTPRMVRYIKERETHRLEAKQRRADDPGGNAPPSR